MSGTHLYVLGTPFPSMYLHLFFFIEDQNYLNREDVRWDKMLYLIQNIIIEMGPISVTTKLIDILRTGIVGILHTLHCLVYLKHVVQQADLFNLIIFIYKHLCLLFSISQDVEMVLWQCDSFNCIYDTQVFFF